MSGILARRYAKALFEHSRDQKMEQAVSEDLRLLKKLLTANPSLQVFFENPAISSEDKVQTLKKVFEPACQPLTFRFILFLQNKARLYLFKEIIESYEAIFKTSEGVLTVKVKSAQAIEPDQLTKILDKLKDRFQRKVEANVEINEHLLGGVIVDVEGKVLDFSLSRQLRKFYDSVVLQN